MALIAVAPVALMGCVSQTLPPDAARASFAPDYRGTQVMPLDADLVNIRVTMRGARGPLDVVRYAECAAADYALVQGNAFARHIRTTVDETAGIWTADAVYTVSPDLPRGSRIIDAETTVADCGATGVPTVQRD